MILKNLQKGGSYSFQIIQRKEYLNQLMGKKKKRIILPTVLLICLFCLTTTANAANYNAGGLIGKVNSKHDQLQGYLHISNKKDSSYVDRPNLTVRSIRDSAGNIINVAAFNPKKLNISMILDSTDYNHAISKNKHSLFPKYNKSPYTTKKINESYWKKHTVKNTKENKKKYKKKHGYKVKGKEIIYYTRETRTIVKKNNGVMINGGFFGSTCQNCKRAGMKAYESCNHYDADTLYNVRPINVVNWNKKCFNWGYQGYDKVNTWWYFGFFADGSPYLGTSNSTLKNLKWAVSIQNFKILVYDYKLMKDENWGGHKKKNKQSAIGFRNDGTVIVMTANNMTDLELENQMLAFGCRYAAQLDSSNSSQMACVNNGRLVNLTPKNKRALPVTFSFTEFI